MIITTELKKELDRLVIRYETKDFIKDDPIQFPHRFKDEKDIEISAFLASLFAYGKRELFIAKLDAMFCIMQNQPYSFVLDFDITNKAFGDFNYRFSKGIDLVQVLLILKGLYSKKSSLKTLFYQNYKSHQEVLPMLSQVLDYFYSQVELDVTAGFYHMLPHPKNNGAVKRLNMLMRWLVRDGEVDVGVWDFVDKSKLLIPLDVHVGRISRKLNMLTRSSNDIKSVLELTDKLKDFDSKDPVKYDFALFGYGINLAK